MESVKEIKIKHRESESSEGKKKIKKIKLYDSIK